MICVLLAKPVLQLMNTPVDILEDATSYVTIFFGGLVSIIVYSLVLYVLNDKFFINIIKKYFYKIKRRFL